MTLTSFKIETADVSFSGGVFAVRGLSLNNVLNIINLHKDDMTELFSAFSNGVADPNKQAGSLLARAPSLVATIIAEGCMEKVDSEVTGTLPVTVQLDALRKIGGLTFATQSPKDFMEAAVQILEQTTGVLNSR